MLRARGRSAAPLARRRLRSKGWQTTRLAPSHPIARRVHDGLRRREGIDQVAHLRGALLGELPRGEVLLGRARLTSGRERAPEEAAYSLHTSELHRRSSAPLGSGIQRPHEAEEVAHLGERKGWRAVR